MMKRTSLMLALLIFGTACKHLPDEQWTELQNLRRDLRRAEAHRYLPVQFAKFDSDFGILQRAYAVETNRYALFRDTKKISDQVRGMTSQARMLKSEVKVRTERLRSEQRMHLDELKSNLETLRNSTLDPDRRRPIAKMLLALDQSRKSWEQADYLRSQEILQAVQTDWNELKSHLNEVTERFRDPRLRRKWKLWVQQTIHQSQKTGKETLIVDKLHRRARLYRAGAVVREFAVDLGWNQYPNKTRQNDGATPEGRYLVRRKKGPGQTQYHLALLLNYPNASDRRAFTEAKRQGEVEQRARIGGLIEIHGEGGRGKDWTEGCVALSNPDMEILFQSAYVGMPVTVVGDTSDAEPR